MENKSLTEIKVGEIAPTKFGLDLMASSIAEQVADGNLNSLDVAIRMNAMEQLCKLVKEKIQDSVMDELYKHPKQKADVYGATISEMTSVKYDYSHIEEWSILEGIIQNAKEKQKEIEEEEKKWRRGELPVKSATSTFKVQLSK
jgi:hypothetical protein